MAPAAKRARLHTGSSSPPKPSSSPVKGAARRPLGSKLPPSPLKRASLPSSSAAGQAGDGSDEEDQGADPLAHPVPRQRPSHPQLQQHLDASTASTSFITSSTGDAYLLASASPSKTSDHLLSSLLPSGPFTLDSYAQALASHDSNPVLASQRAALNLNSTTYDSKYFDKWCWELGQGFNILLHGFGSKKDLLDRFAEKARTKGEVVVVNEFDRQCGLGDVVAMLEEIVKGWERGDEKRKGGARASPRKAGASPKKGAGTPRKGKEKATVNDEDDDPTTTSRSLHVFPPSISALESRIRRLLHSLTLHQTQTSSPRRPPIYLLIHSLDGPTLRLPKTLSLLALLAAQPGIHLVASIDHLRAALLFPSSLLTTRPEGLMKPYRPTTTLGGKGRGGSAETTPQGTPASAAQAVEEPEAAPTTNYHLRTFTFLPYHVPTLSPYTLETSHASTLSHLLPSSIFPALTSATDRSTESLKQSVGHVLDSVTERAKRVFEALGRLMLEESGEEGAAWMGLKGASGTPAPGCAVSLEVFKNHCTDRLLAAHNDQVDALLSEFRDHGVVRGSLIPPTRQAEEGDEEEGGGEEWVWIPLEKGGLEEVLEEMAA